MDLINKGIDMLKNVKTYWKEPPEGKYMTFKEILALSIKVCKFFKKLDK